MDVEEISYIPEVGLVVKRMIDCDVKMLGLFNTAEENMEERAKYGRTVLELNRMIQRTMEIETQHVTPLAREIETNIQLYTTLYTLCENPSIIHPTLLTKLYDALDDRLEECNEEVENIVISFIREPVKRNVLTKLVCEYTKFLKSVKKKLTNFYLEQPYRTLELSGSLSEKLLTVDVCLSPAFLPYITGNLSPPKWMVPRTVRTINDARRIHQTREYIKKEGMNLFVQLANSPTLPFVLWKMVAEYAVDLSKLRINFCDVVTEEMLRFCKYDHLVHARYMANTSHVKVTIIV